MAKLWLFWALALAQEASLERLILRIDGTYEAHWKVVCRGNVPYEVRLPGRLTHLSASQKTPLFALSIEPDTLWGPFTAASLETSALPLGISVVATYLAGSDPEEVKGTLQAHTTDYIIISTPQGSHRINRPYLISLYTSEQGEGASCHPATRLRLFPQNTPTDSLFHLFTWGKLADSLSFLYLIESSEGDLYKLTAWVKIPPLWGKSYETNLEVQWRDSLTWSMGRLRVPAHEYFQVRLAEYRLRGRVGYLFSLASQSFLEDSALAVVEARPILNLSSEEPLRLPPGRGYLWLASGASISLPETMGASIRVPYPSPNGLRAVLQEALRTPDRKGPPVAMGTLRVTNPLSEPAYLIVERLVPGKPLPAATGLARVERRDSQYLISWEAVVAPGQTMSFSYAYTRP